LIVFPNATSAFEFLFFQLQLIDYQSLNRGSTQPLLTQTDLKAHRFANPGTAVLHAFHLLISTLFARTDSADRESAKLATLRDYLLPRLLSGRVRVAGAGIDAHTAGGVAAKDQGRHAARHDGDRLTALGSDPGRKAY